jgi:transcriptional regulator GlxA family with amidase domain
MAVLSGFTPSSFSRAFKRHTGLTFVRYVNRLRIDNSCDLLMTTDDSVADICFQVGFNNLSNFNRHFIAQKRISPSAFRREYRENVRGRFVEAGPDLALQATVAGGLRG